MTEDHISEILRELPERISDPVKIWANRSPGNVALVDASGIWTYAQLACAVGKTREWLMDLGIRPGDRVMVVCENCRALVAILFALSEMDAWPVLVNSRLSSREIDEIQQHCSARRIFFTVNVSPQAANHARRYNAAIENVDELGLIGISPTNLDTVPEIPEENPSGRIAALIYTSGTTGHPKGVMLTHRNLLFVAAVSADIRSLAPADRLYGVLPISHAVGFAVVLLGTILRGATLYLAERFDPVAALATMKREALTVLLGAPAMFSLLVDYANLKGYKSVTFPALRVISSSGAPLQTELKSQVEALFGMTLHNGYGITECSPNIAQTRLEFPRKDVSVGRIFPGVEVRLTDGSGQNVNEGEIGELFVRGPNVMKGYYRAPVETAAVIDEDGWFQTGDLARLQDENLFIEGRSKDLIIHFGFNVYPAEVEAVLNSHPAVMRSAVIGNAIGGTGGDEEIVAFVQLVPSSRVDAAELKQHSATRLAPYKRPSSIRLVSDMPLTPTGKIKKEELSKMIECTS